MTDAQFRSWLKIKLEGAANRPHLHRSDRRMHPKGYKSSFSYSPEKLVEDIEYIAREARTRVGKVKKS